MHENACGHDWARETSTRKPKSGGAVQLGEHLLKTWSSTQSVVALSSGEPELYAIVKAATDAMGILSLLADLGLGCRLRMFTDSTAGKAIVSRRGLGRVRHLGVEDSGAVRLSLRRCLDQKTWRTF